MSAKYYINAEMLRQRGACDPACRRFQAKYGNQKVLVNAASIERMDRTERYNLRYVASLGHRRAMWLYPRSAKNRTKAARLEREFDALERRIQRESYPHLASARNTANLLKVLNECGDAWAKLKELEKCPQRQPIHYF